MSLIPAFFPGRRDIGPEEPSLGVEDEKAAPRERLPSPSWMGQRRGGDVSLTFW